MSSQSTSIKHCRHIQLSTTDVSLVGGLEEITGHHQSHGSNRKHYLAPGNQFDGYELIRAFAKEETGLKSVGGDCCHQDFA